MLNFVALLALSLPNVEDRGYAHIQRQLPGLTFREARTLLREARLAERPPAPQSKIEHMVVLFVENRAADHIFGCMLGDRPDFDGIPTRPDGGHWKLFPAEPGTGSGPAAKQVNVSCGTADQVCHGAPNESTRMFSAAQLPVKHAISESFAVFNKMFTSVPGPSWPNHLFSQSATSCGTSSNVMYNTCGGKTAQFPQMTIFDSLALANVPFGIYVNDTCGPNTTLSCGDVTPGWGTNTGTNASTGLDPDVTMAGVARHKSHFFSHTLLYEQAAAGALPAFSWISPAHEASDHPCFDMAKGERMLKDIYEALRNGPGWNKTLFVVTYDDYGGFYDHVERPAAPHDESPCNVWNAQHNVSKTGPTDCPNAFDFQQLGLRSSTMLISPWIKKASIINEPLKRGDRADWHGSSEPPPQWDHTSMLATAKNLFGLPDFLTKRDAWAGSFDELLLEQPRALDDTPLHLPPALAPAKPWGPPHMWGEGWDEEDDDEIDLIDDDGDDGEDDDGTDDDDEAAGKMGFPIKREGRGAPPHHCSASFEEIGKEKCQGPKAVTAKQRLQIALYSALTQTPAPDIDVMDYESAGAWAKARWLEYMAMDLE